MLFSLLSSRASNLSLADEPLSVQRARNKSSEMELQEMSEKLSRRLDELDQVSAVCDVSALYLYLYLAIGRVSLCTC